MELIAWFETGKRAGVGTGCVLCIQVTAVVTGRINKPPTNKLGL